jgi:large subunit ribosomal protein L15
VRRLPHKRGFHNIFKVRYSVVNVERLARFRKGRKVDPEVLAEAGIIKSTRQPVKILGAGDIGKPLTVSAHRFSASAKEKIEAAGGTVIELEQLEA